MVSDPNTINCRDDSYLLGCQIRMALPSCQRTHLSSNSEPFSWNGSLSRLKPTHLDMVPGWKKAWDTASDTSPVWSPSILRSCACITSLLTINGMSVQLSSRYMQLLRDLLWLLTDNANGLILIKRDGVGCYFYEFRPSSVFTPGADPQTSSCGRSQSPSLLQLPPYKPPHVLCSVSSWRPSR